MLNKNDMIQNLRDLIEFVDKSEGYPCSDEDKFFNDITRFTLEVGLHLSGRIRRRAESLDLTVNEYLIALVDNDLQPDNEIKYNYLTKEVEHAK